MAFGGHRWAGGRFGGTKPYVGTHRPGRQVGASKGFGRDGVVQPACPLRRRCGDMRELAGCTKLAGLQPIKMLLGRFEGGCALPSNKSSSPPRSVSHAHASATVPLYPLDQWILKLSLWCPRSLAQAGVSGWTHSSLPTFWKTLT